MAKTILISETTLKEKSIINDNVDYEMLMPMIEVVQDLYLQKILGTDLFVKLCNDVDAYVTSSTPIPVNYKKLLDDYIADYLTWMLSAKSGVVLKFRFMNKGVMEKSSDNSQPISTDDLTSLSKEYENFAQQYGQNLIKYIENNLSLYPEYSTNTGHEDTPTGMAYDSPFIFPSQSFDTDIETRDWWNRR